MAFIIADATKPQAHLMRREKEALKDAFNLANEINRQMDQMTDEQITDQFGIPADTVSAFRANVDNLLTALSGTAVTNFISSLGFDR